MELLAVIAIIAILASVALPAMSSVQQGFRMTQGAGIVIDQLSLARQMAGSKNRVVETRFYGWTESGGGKMYRGMQNFELREDGAAVPLDRMVRFPQGIVIDSGGSLSPLLGSSQIKQWTSNDTQVNVPGAGTSYDTRVIRLRPDGSTDLAAAGQPWYLTIHAERDGDGLSALPKNFAMIQVDPWTGRASLYRP
jgi:uncharacterized protein (TIGR02596 family)